MSGAFLCDSWPKWFNSRVHGCGPFTAMITPVIPGDLGTIRAIIGNSIGKPVGNGPIRSVTLKVML